MVGSSQVPNWSSNTPLFGSTDLRYSPAAGVHSNTLYVVYATPSLFYATMTFVDNGKTIWSTSISVVNVNGTQLECKASPAVVNINDEF